MRILTQPDSIIRISIHKNGDDVKYINLIETNVKAVVRMVHSVINKQKLSPIQKGYSTAVRVRESVKGIYKGNQSVSFKGLSVEQTYDILIAEITKISK